VYVIPFAPGWEKRLVGKWQVSIARGEQPRFRADGKEFSYVAPDRKLMAVEVKPSAETFDHGTPKVLFDSPSDTPANAVAVWGYVPSADGQRFLISTPGGGRDEAQPFTVIVNWLGAVKK
jgi:hypothetical protein